MAAWDDLEPWLKILSYQYRNSNYNYKIRRYHGRLIFIKEIPLHENDPDRFNIKLRLILRFHFVTKSLMKYSKYSYYGIISFYDIHTNRGNWARYRVRIPVYCCRNISAGKLMNNMTYFIVAQSFWNCIWSSAQYKTITSVLWTKGISRDSSSWLVWEGCSM